MPMERQVGIIQAHWGPSKMPGEENRVPNTDLSRGMQVQVSTMQASHLVHLKMTQTFVVGPKCFTPGCALDTLLEIGTLVLYDHLPILLAFYPRSKGMGKQSRKCNLEIKHTLSPTTLIVPEAGHLFKSPFCLIFSKTCRFPNELKSKSM